MRCSSVPGRRQQELRSVARGAPPARLHTLHRQRPSAVTFAVSSDSSGHPEVGPAVLVCLHAPLTCCRCFLDTVTARAWYWKALVLLLLLLTTSQLYFNMFMYRDTKALFTFNTSSTGMTWLSDGRPFLKDQWGRLANAWLRPMNVRSSGTTAAAAGEESTQDSVLDQDMLRVVNGSENTSSQSGGLVVASSVSTRFSNSSNNNHSSSSSSGGNSSSSESISTNKMSSNNKGSSSSSSSSNMTTTVKHKNLRSKELPPCPPVPPDLKGHDLPDLSPASIPLLERQHPELLPGGRWLSPDCHSSHRVAIIIPYRDREAHLAILLRHMHPFLQRQQLDYTIFVVEQAGKGTFNRAQLLNIGALESLKLRPFDCFVFHDIDLLPEDDRNLYTCPQQPRHMSVAINTMRYKLPYNDIFGGVSALSVNHFRKVNGFSNKFWGWGGEDDDMSNRIKHHDLYISRYPPSVARYIMLDHKKDKPNPQRYQYLYSGKKRFDTEGLNSIRYKIQDVQLRRLYTWIYVEALRS